MQHTTDPKFGGGVSLNPAEPEPKRQRTQQETNLLSLINSKLTASLGGPQVHDSQDVEGPIVEQEDEDGDIEIATDSEEGELDIPKPLPKVLTPAQKKKKDRKDRILTKDRGNVLHTIISSDVEPHQSTVAWDQEPEILCSYNWSGNVDGSNTIFVPGGPSKWTPQNIPYTVPGDQGFHPTDYNYVRQPRDPFSAVFHAMTLMNPEYAFNNIDILADRNNLRVLLEFVQGKTVGPFRLDLYMVFGTLVIIRREDGFWRRSDGKNYGFNFEKHFTSPTPDMTDATSHYRAIRYRMGPLNVVCRFEADAYVDTAADILSTSEVDAVIPPVPTEPDLMERPRFTYRAPFRVLQKGHLVPASQILELKTQVEKPREDGQSLVSCQDQLWFGRTTHLYTGRYEAGTGKILQIKHEDATERVRRWEQKNQQELQKLVGLLIMLKGMLMRQQGPLRAAILVREDPRGPITLHEMLDKQNVVQRQFFERHWMRNHRPRPYAQNSPRGGQYGGRGRGQADAQRPQVNAQRGQAYRPRSPARTQRSDPNSGRLNGDGRPRSHHNTSRDAPRRGPGGNRGRGNASRGGRGTAEQGQN
ncbi:hypothetical protein EKO04_010709 [Ascochyta lentis]|uniref:Uncharacterized protein n=1 Tax=Ascochyta lentis TaxID=205686 RepID=A0A8H7ME04_9PLEO|nr:hypothetical protein EKO04_010709 [Ascochyta lentis]